MIKKLGEGTFSEVFKAQSLKNGMYVAIKCMKAHYQSKEEVNNLREVRALKRLSTHSNIISLIEVLYDDLTGRLALVFALMEMNLYEAIKGRNTFLPEKKVKHWMYQVLKSLNFMHRNGIFHRDIKPENILLKDDNIIKLADLGSCKGIYSKPPFTEYISTRWYRAPECLLTDGYYNYKMDIWGVGCVFFEMLSLFPLFPGDDEIDQVNKIHGILGSPNIELFNKMLSHSTRNDIIYEKKVGVGIKKFLPNVSSECIDLINKMLIYNPDERITAKQALNHSYFKDLVESEQKKMMSLNDSISFIKGEDSMFIHRKANNKKENKKDTMILPNIKVYNYSIMEDSEENSKQNYNNGYYQVGGNMESFVKLPRIKFQFGKEKGNYLNSNEFKNSLKHNLSNHSIDNIINIKTQYAKSLRKRISEVKKNYVSPYSKKNIENNIQI